MFTLEVNKAEEPSKITTNSVLLYKDSSYRIGNRRSIEIFTLLMILTMACSTLEVLIGVLIINIIILCSISYNSLQFGLYAVKDIKNNWQKNPIIDIVATKEVCPFQYEPFISDEWGGTVEGCNCVGQWSDKIPHSSQNQLNREACDYNMTEAGCRSVKALKPVEYKRWKGVSLCALRSSMTYNDYVLHMAASNKGCRGNYGQCGIMDSLGNFMCINKGEKCPVNKIVFQRNYTADPKDFNYKKIPLESGYNVFFTNEAIKSKVLLDIKISEGPACIYPGEKNTEFKQYLLDRDFYFYNCTTMLDNFLYDNRYVQLDSYKKKDLFIQNGIAPLLTYLPYFPYSSLDAEVNLLTRPFIGWKENCINDELFGPQVIIRIVNQLEGVINNKAYIITLSFILLLYFIIEVSFKFQNMDTILYFNLFEFGFFLIAFVIFILTCSNSGDYSKFEDFNCGDDITNWLFNYLFKKLNENSSSETIIFLSSMFNCFAYFLYIIFDYFCQLCFRRRTSYEQNRRNSYEELPGDI